MKKTEEYRICASCGSGKVKQTTREKKNGEVTVAVSNCTVCKRSYGVKGFQELAPIAND